MSDAKPQIFIFTAGNAAARSHLDDSILSPIAPNVIFDNYVESDQQALEDIEKEHGFFAWGAVPGPQNVKRWQRLEKGDWVLCVYDSAYHFAARVVAKYDNADCARAVWGTDPKGETWQYMYFLTKPIKTNVPLSALADYLGARYMGFTRISDGKLAKIRTAFGSIDEFVKKAVIDGNQIDPPVTGEQYFLIRSNPDSQWDDEERSVYRFGSTDPNYKRLMQGGRVVVDSKASGALKIIGYGVLKPTVYNDTHQTEQRTNQRFEAQVIDWTPTDPPRELNAALMAELRAHLGYNVQHAVRPITKELFKKLTVDEKYWLFQCNPEYFDGRKALQQLSQIWWSVNQNKTMWKPGQKGIFWESGSEGGVIGLGEFLSAPQMVEPDEGDLEYAKDQSKFEGLRLRIQIRVERALEPPITREQVKNDERLRNLPVLKFANATNFEISPEEYAAVVDLASVNPGAESLRDVVDNFAGALQQSNIDFGADHDDTIRAFVASLATKPFVILTGLSGSGKTQLAIRFGDWLGVGRLHVAAVRPDWTGAESLFGYEDALQPVDESGFRAWHVPEPLKFMLTAAANSSDPYMLVLDEMNLAHVERYFADVLSGMESKKPCLPNLTKGPDGSWRQQNVKTHISFPSNLFVVGTVNIDETTYMFSPKVLDRANTFEFRVSDMDLKDHYSPPEECPEAPAYLRRAFLTEAQNDRVTESNLSAVRQEIADKLRACHRILSPHGFEFGHRVFSEALRFSTLYLETGVTDTSMVLDRILMQKVLPRLHGSRRRLEKPLTELAGFAYDPDSTIDGDFTLDEVETSAAILPISFDKLRRMILTVRANQFVSFTE